MFYSELSMDLETFLKALGLIGFGIYVTGFMLLSTGRLDSRGTRYFAMTLVDSTCVLLSLTVDFNLSSALIQIFYVLVSLSAIFLRARPNPHPRPVPVRV